MKWGIVFQISPEKPPITTLALPDFSKLSLIAKPHKVEAVVDSSKPYPGEILKRDWLMKHRTRVPAVVDAMFDSNHVKRIKPEVHKLEDMVNSYEIDDALFFKSLKLLGGKDAQARGYGQFI
ncbi:hypothetical protein GIB67_022968 [Kingdonia uniflora]|uniref:Uncharacterized protein n=1 Tax=Kingdonia uniflora TaxID=39325 RepID=A0A7J7P2D2_9MAGN|nr:hypothetical protein GIB67_022968 [Kingdonia uniflora]